MRQESDDASTSVPQLHPHSGVALAVAALAGDPGVTIRPAPRLVREDNKAGHPGALRTVARREIT